jgi:cobalamin biosynthesis Mg chelatase CobN
MTSPFAISGFFRDAFPHVVAMLDDAVRLVADLDSHTTSTSYGSMPKMIW